MLTGHTKFAHDLLLADLVKTMRTCDIFSEETLIANKRRVAYVVKMFGANKIGSYRRAFNIAYSKITGTTKYHKIEALKDDNASLFCQG